MRILILAAHPDDVSLSMGIKIQQHVIAGDDVFVHSFSGVKEVAICSERSADCGGSLLVSVGLLGVKRCTESTLVPGSFENLRGEILWEMKELFSTYTPDLLYTHFPHDFHHDHEVVSQEALSAASSTSCVIYFGSPGTHHFHPTMIALGTPQMLQHKLEALRCFSVQHYVTEMLDELPVHSAGLLLEYLPHELLYKRQQEGKDYFAELFCVERMVQF